ncbi:MAG: MgtC/SapB family protein [Acidimicrobiia bacterium]
MTSVEIIINLVIATLLSGLVGIDRELRKRDAGLRTHMLVGLGAAVFSIVGLQVGEDPSRVAAQVVTGIGFLGAGTIFRAGNSVRGLTTAAGLWTVAGIGVATNRHGAVCRSHHRDDPWMGGHPQPSTCERAPRPRRRRCRIGPCAV